MPKKYTPSTIETVREISSHFYKKISDDNFIGPIAALGMGVGLNVLPYAVPTYVRDRREIPDSNVDNLLEREKWIGYTAGGIAGLGLVAQLLTYINVGENHPEIFLLPITTNVVSLGYEIIRGARQRLIERHSGQTLDNHIG